MSVSDDIYSTSYVLIELCKLLFYFLRIQHLASMLFGFNSMDFCAVFSILRNCLFSLKYYNCSHFYHSLKHLLFKKWTWSAFKKAEANPNEQNYSNTSWIKIGFPETLRTERWRIIHQCTDKPRPTVKDYLLPEKRWIKLLVLGGHLSLTGF